MFVYRGGPATGRRSGRAVPCPATRVHLHELTSLSAAQLRLVGALQPALPHLLARLVLLELRLRQLAFGDLARVADERRDDRSVRIEPSRRVPNDQLGEAEPMLLEHAHDVERRVGEDHRRTRRRTPEAAHRLLDLRRRDVARAGTPLEPGADVEVVLIG